MDHLVKCDLKSIDAKNAETSPLPCAFVTFVVKMNRQNLSCKLVQDLNFHRHLVVLGMRTDDYYVVQRINMASQVNKCTW